MFSQLHINSALISIGMQQSFEKKQPCDRHKISKHVKRWPSAFNADTYISFELLVPVLLLPVCQFKVTSCVPYTLDLFSMPCSHRDQYTGTLSTKDLTRDDTR
jgi:hypothetical protein